jgi:hypothetical protein
MPQAAAADDQKPRIGVPVSPQEEGVRHQLGRPAQTDGKRKLGLETRKRTAQIEVSYLATEMCMKRTHYFALEDVDKINSLRHVQLFFLALRFFCEFLNDYYFSTDYPN